MLTIEGLQVEVGGKPILSNVNMEIPAGETHILFGPNGSGKTSLMMTLMGFAGYRVTRGKIMFKGEDITHLPIHERAQLGRWSNSADTGAPSIWMPWPRRPR